MQRHVRWVLGVFFLATISNAKYNHEERRLFELARPVKCTSNGIRCFIKHVYNCSEYGQDFLPLSFSHLLQFLEHGSGVQGRSYADSVLRLFMRKLNETFYINAYAFEELITYMPELLAPYCAENLKDNKLHTAFQEILYTNFLHEYRSFRENPRQFFDDLSGTLLKSVHREYQDLDQEISLADLRIITLRFLERAVGKIIWDVDDQMAVWESVKSIGNKLVTFADHEILVESIDFNDLFWTLITRFAYFIELEGSRLSLKVYEKIERDIAAGELLFLTLEEDEEYVLPKVDYFKRVLLSGKAKAHAFDLGMITD